MNKATLIKKNLNGFRGDARLYKLNPAMEQGDVSIKYVVVSGTHVPYSGFETYIFPSNKDGEVVSWGELEGSFRGDIDHEKALEGAGYTVV